jgi:hypothetical protein
MDADSGSDAGGIRKQVTIDWYGVMTTLRP